MNTESRRGFHTDGITEEGQACLDVIFSRRSYRGKYRPDPVPREHLDAILRAGLSAPSGCNRQTVSLIAVDDPTLLARIRAAIDPPAGETAPAVICVLSRRIIAYRDRCFATQDYAAAIENMLLAITALGYRSCWYEGHITDTDRICDKIAEILDVPEGTELVCVLPVGIAEEEARLPKKKPFAERAWYNGFGGGTERSRMRVAQMLQKYHNHDSRLPYYELILEGKLTDLPVMPLPAGYRFENYRDGDREAWIRIERSAKEFSSWDEGEEAWRKYYEGHEEELKKRMFFVVNEQGQKAATATAFYDIRSADDGVNGMLHWVAVCAEEQGKGLSKPLILKALHTMKDSGYTRAVIPTQTTTWLACKVYLDLGFRPVPRNAERSRKGWELIRSLTWHPALAEFAGAEEKGSDAEGTLL